MGRTKDDKPNKFTMFIGGQVKQARNEVGLTQEQLGKLMYSSRSTIKQIESGKVEPTITSLMQIATVLEKPITYFLPMPPEYRAAEDELPDWIRECVIHLKRIWGEGNQRMILTMIKSAADEETKQDIENNGPDQ